MIIHPKFRDFDFLCLRENRRVVQDAARSAELREFHEVLMDISMGRASDAVRAFLVDAYVRGQQVSIVRPR